MAFRFLVQHPVLSPLFAAVALGIGGGVVYGGHLLMNGPDVVLARKQNGTPWNNVQQHENTKLLSVNKNFWSGRVGMPDPRAAFLDGTGAPKSSASSTAKAKVQEIKAKRASDV